MRWQHQWALVAATGKQGKYEAGRQQQENSGHGQVSWRRSQYSETAVLGTAGFIQAAVVTSPRL
jgi:hypothetical protein